jgi:predicted CopG family antitoxin
MSTATVRIPEDKRDTLKIIASIEKKEMKDILSELIDEYIERHRETLDLLSKPEWVKEIRRGKKEVEKGTKGKVVLEPATMDVQELEGLLYKSGRKKVSIKDMNLAIKQRHGKSIK